MKNAATQASAPESFETGILWTGLALVFSMASSLVFRYLPCFVTTWACEKRWPALISSCVGFCFGTVLFMLSFTRLGWLRKETADFIASIFPFSAVPLMKYVGGGPYKRCGRHGAAFRVRDCYHEGEATTLNDTAHARVQARRRCICTAALVFILVSMNTLWLVGLYGWLDSVDD